jgi:hypothetical protein
LKNNNAQLECEIENIKAEIINLRHWIC